MGALVIMFILTSEIPVEPGPVDEALILRQSKLASDDTLTDSGLPTQIQRPRFLLVETISSSVIFN